MNDKEEQLSFEVDAQPASSRSDQSPPVEVPSLKPESVNLKPEPADADPEPADAEPEPAGAESEPADEATERIDEAAATDAPDQPKPAQIRRDLIKPGKIFYKMGDVCDITGLEPHVLRFWEAEFEQLQPKKNRSRHRIYTVEDIELVICIRRLLHEEGYTIPGARKKLEDPAYESGENHGKPKEMQFILNEISGIRKSLESAIKLLDGP